MALTPVAPKGVCNMALEINIFAGCGRTVTGMDLLSLASLFKGEGLTWSAMGEAARFIHRYGIVIQPSAFVNLSDLYGTDYESQLH